MSNLPWGDQIINGTRSNLDDNIEFIQQKKCQILLKFSDIPLNKRHGEVPVAILGIEGGDFLGDHIEHLDAVYKRGVRIITSVHACNNQIGGSINIKNKHNGLSDYGKKIVSRMEKLGVMIDLAHTNSITLNDLTENTSLPLIDSHTNPGNGRRLRNWWDIERIVKTGG